MDSKLEVDSINGVVDDVSNFSTIIHECKELFLISCFNSHAEFTRMDADMIVHCLTKATVS